MVKIESFEKNSKEYEKWFIKNHDIYIAELNALKSLVPPNKYGVEIGVGTGRFALPLEIKVGIEPSKKMAEISINRGIKVYDGIAEQLPFDNETFDFVLFVTTICFVDDLQESFREAYRVLKNKGFIIVGFVDKESELGRCYQLNRDKSKFYINATFYSAKEVLDFLRKTNFKNFVIKQTVFPSRNSRIDSVEDGYGKGSFVIIKGFKQTNLWES